MTEKIVKFPNLNIEVDFNQEQTGLNLLEIKIRPGWRLLELKELGEVMNYAVENKLKIWSFFKQPVKALEHKYIGRFMIEYSKEDFTSRVDIDCLRYAEIFHEELGVIFCKDLEDK